MGPNMKEEEDEKTTDTCIDKEWNMEIFYGALFFTFFNVQNLIFDKKTVDDVGCSSDVDVFMSSTFICRNNNNVNLI